MKELVEIQYKLKAPKSQFNSFGKYNYRNLEDITEAAKPIMASLGCYLLMSDSIELVGDRHYVCATATIYNAEGANLSVKAYARESLDKKGMDFAQITGATSSYARKYALNGLFAIDDTKDADSTNEHGNSASQQVKQQPRQAPQQQPQAATQAQIDEIDNLGVDKAAAIAWVNGHYGTNYAAIEDLPAQYAQAIINGKKKQGC